MSAQINFAPIFREAKETDAAKLVRVHVSGEVRKPSLFTLPNGARVVDAIKKAGGATSQADINNLNLATKLQDGQKIAVPRRGQNADRVLEVGNLNVENIASTNPLQNGAAKRLSRVVNINSASATELETLPGVGPAIAARIVVERARKPFTSVQDVDRVNGIGPKKLQQIAPHITF